VLAERLVAARRPVIVAGYAGRDPRAFDQLVELSELLAIGVIDTGRRLNFPSRHPLNVTGSDALEDADCVLFVDVKDMAKSTRSWTGRRAGPAAGSPGAAVLDIGFNEVGLSAWSHDFAQLHETDLQVTADTAVALPLAARALGWHAEGPIDDPDVIQAAVRRAAAIVAEQRRPALVDVVCQPR
jgi:acetolactate synthase I/II/III large subunit